MARLKPNPAVSELAHRRFALDEEKKREMLAILIRNPLAFEAVQDPEKPDELLTIKNLSTWSRPLALVWKLVRRFYRDYAELPGRLQLTSDLHQELSGDPSLLQHEERVLVDEFIEYAYDPAHGKIAKSRKHFRSAIATCKQFLEEVEVGKIQNRLLGLDSTYPIDLPALLAEVRNRVDVIQSLSDVEIDVPYPDNWDVRQEPQLLSTGCKALDSFMGGGYRAGEVILFMGPYGSCKTTLACNSVANQLKMAAAMYAEENARKNAKGDQLVPLIVLIFTESDVNEYRDRLMSNMARVPWRRLSGMTSLDDLDDSDAPGATEETQYELKVFQRDIENGRPWRSERKRVEAAVRLANKHLLLVDCTDSEESPHQIGKGGMHEIANVLQSIFRRQRKDSYPLSVWLDHMSGLVDRMSEADLDEAELRRVLTNMPRVAGEKIGKPLRTPIVIFHQFAGASQNKGAAAKYHHGEAEGSKSVGKYVNFAVVAGPVDGNGMCKWECTKHRREPPKKIGIIKVQGRFNRIIDCTLTHGVNDQQRCIMPLAEMGITGTVSETVNDPLNVEV